MAGRGPAPKASKLRQRRNKKSSAATFEEPKNQAQTVIPDLPNPGRRRWHRLTRIWWRHVWESPMAGEYIQTDIDGLARLALLIDQFYREPDKNILAEIRLQEARFGLSPVDRTRMQWEIQKNKPPDVKKRGKSSPVKVDPRELLEQMN